MDVSVSESHPTTVLLWMQAQKTRRPVGPNDGAREYPNRILADVGGDVKWYAIRRYRPA
jgi:hypothetical protein